MTTRYLAIGLTSLTLIGLELIWTRIFSAEFFYTFAFLILSLAILGLGMGALTLRLIPKVDNRGFLGIILSLGGLAAIIGPPAVIHLGLNFSQLPGSPAMLGQLVLTIMLLALPYYFGGMALAMMFKQNSDKMPKLYMADLLGAGSGVLMAIIFMNQLGTPTAVFWAVLPVLIGSLIVSRRWLKIIPVFLLVVMAVTGARSGQLVEPQREERAPVIYRHWDAMGLVRQYEYGNGYRGLEIDRAANSPVWEFDGNWERPDSMPLQFGIDVATLIDRFDSCVFLSLGSGGGTDVLQALYYGAVEVHAVEVNGHINRMMLEGDSAGYSPPAPNPEDSLPDTNTRTYAVLPEFTGYIYHDPRVKVVTEDARAYVRRHRNKFDIIYSLSSNTFAALASGAFALAENYLFTVEAFEDYWSALSDRGFMMMEHQFYMPRLVGEVMTALARQGVDNVEDHFAVYNLPQMRRKILLLSKQPLDDNLRNSAFAELNEEIFSYIHLLYPATDSTADNLYDRIVQNGWQAEADSVEIDISPCTDNRPFPAQLGLWRNFRWEKPERLLPYEFVAFPLTEVIMVAILLVVLIIVIPLNLLPYLKQGRKLKTVPWIYFFLIGMAFMMVEVVLIQKYAFFVGPSAYSIAIILLTLLIGCGIGSRFSRRCSRGLAFGGILLWLILDVTLFRLFVYGLTELTLIPRLFITAALVFPLGFFMGMPFPKGALKVGDLIDWGFAVNGAASVVGSTLIIMIAVSFGFNVALMLAALIYLSAYVLISRSGAWT